MLTKRFLTTVHGRNGRKDKAALKEWQLYVHRSQWPLLLIMGSESDVVELELKLSSFNRLDIPGLGTLIADDSSDESVYDDDFQLYNGETGLSYGPLIVVDPGDTIKIKLVADLPEADAEYQFFDEY